MVLCCDVLPLRIAQGVALRSKAASKSSAFASSIAFDLLLCAASFTRQYNRTFDFHADFVYLRASFAYPQTDPAASSARLQMLPPTPIAYEKDGVGRTGDRARCVRQTFVPVQSRKSRRISAEEWQKPGGKAAEPFCPRSRQSASSNLLSPSSTVSPYACRAQILPVATRFYPSESRAFCHDVITRFCRFVKPSSYASSAAGDSLPPQLTRGVLTRFCLLHAVAP